MIMLGIDIYKQWNKKGKEDWIQIFYVQNSSEEHKNQRKKKASLKQQIIWTSTRWR